MDQARPAPTSAAEREPGLLEQAGAFWAELRGAAHDQFRLLALEARQAGSRLALMLGLAVMAVALLASAWLGLVAVLVLCMVEAGMPPVAALLAAVGLNLGGVAACALTLRRHARAMPFAATLRGMRNDEAP